MVVEASQAFLGEVVSLRKEEALEASRPLLASVGQEGLEIHPASQARLVESSI